MNRAQKTDYINRKLVQLNALLSVAMDKDFQANSETIKADYLWACYELSMEIRASFRTLDDTNEVQP